MKKKILGLLIAIIMAIPAYATITVSPTRIELNANKIKNNYATTAIEIRGSKNKPMRYKAYTGYFEINDKAEMSVSEGLNTPHNIASKVRFVPSEFTIPAGKSQKVRVNIANIKSLPDGESRAVIYLEDVQPKEYNLPNQNGIGAQLILKTRVAVPVYVDKGKFTKKADVEIFEIARLKDGLYTKMKVVSTGNSRIRYTGTIQVIEGKKLIDEYAIASSAVGDNNSFSSLQKIDTKKITKAGDYTLRLLLSYNDENDNKKIIKKETILKITGEI
ncbi:hypothetical protein J6R97_02140 [bacterium]|nr:hypothetical protein [bacterium]